MLLKGIHFGANILFAILSTLYEHNKCLENVNSIHGKRGHERKKNEHAVLSRWLSYYCYFLKLHSHDL